MQSAEKQSSLVSEVLNDLDADAAFESRDRAGGGWKWSVALLVLAVVAGLGSLGYATLTGTWEKRGANAFLTHPVTRGELLITVTEDGNLESAQNVDIKCEVAGGSTILWIVEDGKEVAQGAELVRLDSAQLEDQINQQRIVFEKARATHIQAEKDYEVAKISVQEYLEGTFRQNLEKVSADITIAKANLTAAENSLQHTERMFRKGYVTPLQLDTQQFAVDRAKLDLAAAATAKDVLEKFTKVKTLQDLQSKRDTAEAKKNSEKAAFDLEEGRLKRLETQLKKCLIHAPKSGMAVYANELSRGRMGPQQTSEIKEGATVREQQAILRLPDLSNMQVKVTVHESKVDRVHRGMRARIRIQGRDFQGTVISVANQPEPGSFFSAAVKEYATIVKIDGESKELRPGMTAEAEILIAALTDVISVPVAAVFEHRGQAFACVAKDGKVEKRAVELGMTNDKAVEIKRGLEEGEQVVLNPRAVLPDLTEGAKEPEKVDVDQRFGKAKAPEARGGRGEKGEGRGEKGNAGAGSPDTRGPNGGKGPGGAGKGRGMDLMQFDKNKDGKIARDELPEQMQAFFDRMDANSDGFIDKAEITAMRARFQKGGKGGPPPDGPPPSP
jgi:RND family efflux transporter MFP subunit